jgi:hypothetical protein
VDTFTRNSDDDADLDELMNRVREAALGASAAVAGSSAATGASGDMAVADSDVARVLDAQGQLNEQMRKALADLVGCLRTLRDDWAEAQKGLRREMGQLSASVRTLQTPSSSASPRRKTPARAARGRRAATSRRADRVRPATKGGKQPS